MKRIITLLSIALLSGTLSPISAAEKDDYVIIVTPKPVKQIDTGETGVQATAYKGKLYTFCPGAIAGRNVIRWHTENDSGTITPERDNKGIAITCDDVGNLALTNGGRYNSQTGSGSPITGVHIYRPDGNLAVKIGFSTEEINAIKSCLYKEICQIISATGDLCGESGGTIRLMGSKIFEIHIGKDRQTGKIITTGHSIYSPSGHNLPDYNYYQNGYVKVISDTEWLIQGFTTASTESVPYLAKYNPIDNVMIPYEPTGSTLNRAIKGIDRFTLRGHQLLLLNDGKNDNSGTPAALKISLYDESFSDNKIFSTTVFIPLGPNPGYRLEPNWLFSNKISDDEYEILQFRYYVGSEPAETTLRTIRTFSVQAVHIDIAFPAPKEFAVTAVTKNDATKGKNSFSGFKATWAATPADALAPIKEYILYYVDNNNKDIEFARTTGTEATLYGMSNACQIKIKAVYTYGKEQRTSTAAAADFVPSPAV